MTAPSFLPVARLFHAEYNDIKEASDTAGQIKLRDVSAATPPPAAWAACHGLPARLSTQQALPFETLLSLIRPLPVPRLMVSPSLFLLQSWKAMFTRPYSPMLVRAGQPLVAWAEWCKAVKGCLPVSPGAIP